MPEGRLLPFPGGEKAAGQEVPTGSHIILPVDNSGRYGGKVILPPEKYAVLQERIAALDPFLQEQIRQNPTMIAQLGLYNGLVLNPPRPEPFKS